MGTPLKCYICDVAVPKRIQKSVFEIKTRHSKKTIAEILERFQNGDIRPRKASNNCVSCDDCIDKINAYDEAFQVAERVEKQLKEMLARTEGNYECDMDPIGSHDTKQLKRSPPLHSNVVTVDPIELDEINDCGSLGFDNDNDAASTNSSEPEEEIDSEEEDFDSDDSFVWPKNSTLKRKREKDKSKENARKKSHIYRCIDCPADYRNKYEMQVIIDSIPVIYMWF